MLRQGRAAEFRSAFISSNCLRIYRLQPVGRYGPSVRQCSYTRALRNSFPEQIRLVKEISSTRVSSRRYVADFGLNCEMIPRMLWNRSISDRFYLNQSGASMFSSWLPLLNIFNFLRTYACRICGRLFLFLLFKF